MKFFATTITLGLVAQAVTQTTTPTPEQWDAISADLEAYVSRLGNDPKILSLKQALETNLPESVLDETENLLPTAFIASGVPYDLLTATPIYLWPSWSTYLPRSVRTELQSFETSFLAAAQSIFTRDLSFTAGATPTPTSSSGAGNDLQAGWMMGVGAGAVGMAAVLL